MSRREPQVVIKLDLENCRPGIVLSPMDPLSDDEKTTFAGWENPLAPMGAFNMDSGLSVVRDSAGHVMEWLGESQDRALVTGSEDWRNCTIRASVLCLSEHASSGDDRNDRREAMAGIVFRMVTSRHYYQFGIEGWKKLVLYRRDDDDWHLLGYQDVLVPDTYADLQVEVDGDCIFCSGLDYQFRVTDYKWRSGKAGFRAVGRCRLSRLEILQTSGQKRDVAILSKLSRQRMEQLGKDLPTPVLKNTIDIAELGGVPTFVDLRESGTHDLLVLSENTTRLISPEGKVLWEIPFSSSAFSLSDPQPDHGRLLCLLAGERSSEETLSVHGAKEKWTVQDEMLVVAGKTGEVLAQVRMPEMDLDLAKADLYRTGASLTGPGKTDFLLREWRKDIGHGGFHLWAFDKDLNELWHTSVNVPYGHADGVHSFDVNKDGKDEVLAGGTLLSPDGRTLWEHDLNHEMETITGAQHYDAVLTGRLADDMDVDPVAFLCGGSAGVYVVDALTGQTRAIHRIGHAQARISAKLRPDLLGTEVLVVCRWGNMGILTLFSGRGDRLWSIQPDYIGQGSCPVWWGDRKSQVLWVNSSRQAMGFYDGFGRKVRELPELARLWGSDMKKDMQCFAAKIGSDTRDHLCVVKAGKLHIFGQS